MEVNDLVRGPQHCGKEQAATLGKAVSERKAVCLCLVSEGFEIGVISGLSQA